MGNAARTWYCLSDNAIQLQVGIVAFNHIMFLIAGKHFFLISCTCEVSYKFGPMIWLFYIVMYFIIFGNILKKFWSKLIFY